MVQRLIQKNLFSNESKFLNESVERMIQRLNEKRHLLAYQCNLEKKSEKLIQQY